MYLRHLELTDFRSWEHVELDLAPGVTVFSGPNGVGKTNLVEAVAYLATLSSRRVATDAPLIRRGAQRAIVRGTVVHAGRELVVEIEIAAGRANRARVNRAPARPRDVAGILRVVQFAPEDLALVRGDPADRRRFLDELLVARQPRFAAVRSDYERVLRQRTALLKTVRGSAADLATLDVWDGHLARHGAELLAGRLELVDALAPLVTEAFAEIAPSSEPAGLSYRAGITVHPGMGVSELEARLLEELTRVRPHEIDRGVCLVGPHRDDLLLSLGDGPAKGYASHGESWAFALALRLGSFRLLSRDGAEPVLVLDDVFAELDRRRRSALAEVAIRAEQTLVTAAVTEDVPSELGGVRFAVGPGSVVRVTTPSPTGRPPAASA